MMGRGPAASLGDLLSERASSDGDSAACFCLDGGRWLPVTWLRLHQQVEAVSAGFRQRGIRPGDRLAIWARTRFEWLVAEFAALSAGAAVVGIDAHASGESAQFVLRHSGAVALLVDSRAQLELLAQSTLRGLRLVSCFEADPKQELLTNTASWRLLAESADSRTDGIADPEMAATVIYTSGTTGQPKGIEYSNRQLLIACGSIGEAYSQLQPGDRTICWLPMASLFQRMMNYVAMARGMVTFFVSDPREIMDRIREVRPSVLIGVPRFYEKLQSGLQAALDETSGAKRRLIDAARSSRREYSSRVQRGEAVPWAVRARHKLLDLLVLRKIRGVTGGHLKFMITGSAPVATWLLEYYDSLGILLLEAYGTSENVIPIAGNRPEAWRFGSVGKVLTGNEVRLDTDGEVLVRGPGVFRGYVGDASPGDRFTPDGYYRTGDLGHFDEAGFLYLTGRKADLIKTSTGRRVSPARVEAVYSQSPLVDQIVVVGNARPYLAALVTPNRPAVERRLAEEGGRSGSSGESERLPEAERLIAADFERMGESLADYERVRCFAIVDAPFSVEGGELTASMKLRRSRIEEKWSDVIDALYAARAREGAAVAGAPA